MESLQMQLRTHHREGSSMRPEEEIRDDVERLENLIAAYDENHAAQDTWNGARNALLWALEDKETGVDVDE